MPRRCACGGFRPPRLEPGVIGHGQRLVHDGFEIAAVVFEGQPGLIGKGIGGDHVAAAQCHPVDVHFPRAVSISRSIT